MEFLVQKTLFKPPLNPTIMQVVEAVRKSYKMTEEEMKRKASMTARERSGKEFAFSQPVFNKENKEL